MNSFSSRDLVHTALRLPLISMCLLLFVSQNTIASDLSPFTSDGCSVFPDGTLAHRALWLKCCYAHDFAYWQGGTYKERLAADRSLETCVTSVGEPAIAKLMLAGVRVGGSPYFPTRFRWGYGWPWPRGYKALTEQEKDMIRRISP